MGVRKLLGAPGCWGAGGACSAAAAAAAALSLTCWCVCATRSSLRSNSILDHLGGGSGTPSAVGQEYQLGPRRLRVLRQLGEGGERPPPTGGWR